jgi:hypothetical protein
LTLRFSGAIALAIGVMCLPVGYGISPKRDLSAFSNLADMGLFLKAALLLVPIGILALTIS